jgi:hypothetical protein
MGADALGHEAKGSRFWGLGGRAGISQDKSAHYDADPGAVDSAKVYARRRRRYRASQLNLLMSRYVKIRGDFKIEWARVPHEEASELGQAAAACVESLGNAKVELESPRRAKLPVVANYLTLADRSLVSLYRPGTLKLRLHSVLGDLGRIKPQPTNEMAQVRRSLKVLDGEFSESDLDVARTALKDAISYVQGYDEQRLIADDLQVSRLNAVLVYVGVGWLLLMAAAPFVSTEQVANDERFWPISDLGLGLRVDLIVGTIGLSVLGAVGGILSGMISVRGSETTISDYRTSMRKLALKPTVGAIAALTVYLFLSAKVLSGVEVTSAGTYIVAGFVAGFSERYLLKVISAQIEAESPAIGQRRHDGSTATTAIEERTELAADRA